MQNQRAACLPLLTERKSSFPHCVWHQQKQWSLYNYVHCTVFLKNLFCITLLQETACLISRVVFLLGKRVCVLFKNIVLPKFLQYRQGTGGGVCVLRE